MSSVDLYKKMRGGKDSDFLDFLFLFGQAKRKEHDKKINSQTNPQMLRSSA
jgi:hypothetical protein